MPVKLLDLATWQGQDRSSQLLLRWIRVPALTFLHDQPLARFAATTPNGRGRCPD
jgi:hypothetical protein